MGVQKIMPKGQYTPQPLPRYDARELIKQGDQANIILDDQIYVLRITRAGKLILTK